MNQNLYNSNSSGFDQFQPLQYSDVHQSPEEISIDELKLMMQFYCERMNQQREQEALLAAQREQELREQDQASQKMEEPLQNSDFHQLIGEIHLIESVLNSKLLSINLKSQRLDKEKKEVKNIIEQVLKCRTRITKSLHNFKVIHRMSSISNTSQISSVVAIAPVLPTEESEYSLSMGDEHLSTILETKSNEVIKSSVKNLVPIPSESEVTFDNESECDVLVNDESFPIFTTFSNLLFDCNDNFTSSDDKSLSNEDVRMENFKIYSNPLVDDEESISPKIDPHYFNAESDLIESLLNQDTLIDSSRKFYFLLEDFSGELAHINPIPSGIEEADFDLEEEIRFNCLAMIPFPFPKTSHLILIIMIIPSFPRPSPEPPDVEVFFKPDSGVLTTKVVKGISEHYVLMPNIFPTIDPLYPMFDILLPFSSENEDKVFKPGVYFVKGLRHNMFLVRQFYDSELEVAFRRNTYFVRNLEGVDLLKGNHTTNLYTFNLHEMASTSPICLMARATSTKYWLWHQHLSHLNFNTINDLAKNDLVTGLLKFKYYKEHLCPSCEQGKSKTSPHKPKPVLNSKQRSKDKAPKVIKTFLKKIQVLLQALIIIIIRTNNRTKFTNQVLKAYFDSVGFSHQTSSFRTPQQNGVVERRNRMLVEAAITMLIVSCASLFLRAEAIKTACYIQNRFLIHQRFDKTPYELINDRKSDISFLHVFGDLRYPKNDHEDIRKLGAKDLVFEAMYNDYIGGQPSDAPRTVPAAPMTQNLQTPNASTTNADSPDIPNTSQDVDELQQHSLSKKMTENHSNLKQLLKMFKMQCSMRIRLKELFTKMSDDDATGAESPSRGVDSYYIPGNFKDPSPIVYPATANGAVNNTTKDGVRLRLFPFSLKDQAKAWFTSLEPGSIHSWSEMQSAFLDEFYSISKTAAIRNKIKSFCQIPGEQFHEAFSRLKELLRTFPHHDVPK
nr:integrase, catalytic region, zinc finger, CCHC-type, peptidase aspartic, catalytic [Tanacetum cinerariifolium]